MSDYEKWKSHITKLENIEMENGTKYVIKDELETYSYVYLEEERKIFLKKVEEFDLKFENFIFDKISVKRNNNLWESFRLDIYLKDENEEVRRIEISSLYKAEKKMLKFFLLGNLTDENIMKLKEFDKIKQIMPYFVDYISSKEKYRILLMVNNIKKEYSDSFNFLLGA